MDQNNFPNKGNLIRNKQILALAAQGQILMEQKRNVLIREMTAFRKQSAKLQKLLALAHKEAEKALINANMQMGSKRVSELVSAMPKENALQIKSRTIMGVELPILTYENTLKKRPHYSIADSVSALDEACKKFNYVKDLIMKLAEAESTANRLELGIRKAQKRANALQYIIIPKCLSRIKFIQDTLEERERDAFVIRMRSRTTDL